MKIINKKYGFSFEIGDSWKETKEDSENISPSTVGLFKRENPNGEVDKLSINVENCEIEKMEEYDKLIDENIKNLKLAYGKEIKIKYSSKNKDKIIDKFYIENSSFNVVMYFTLLENIFIVISGIIKKENDSVDIEILKLVHSLIKI